MGMNYGHNTARLYSLVFQFIEKPEELFQPVVIVVVVAVVVIFVVAAVAVAVAVD